MAPAREKHDPERVLVEELAARVRARPGAFSGVEDLAEAAGVGSSKLARLFRLHFHDAPDRFLLRARVDAARGRLLYGEEAIAEVAREVGFESLSSFDRSFRRLTGLAPSEYRSLRDAASFELRLHASFPLRRTLDYLGRDPESRTERVSGERYEAGMRLDGAAAFLTADFRRGRVRCALAAPRPLPPAAAALAHERLVRRLGLAQNPAPFEAALAARPALAPLVDGRRGLTIPQTFEPFECLAWAIVGQQINLRFARALVGRLVERTGRSVGSGLWAPPEPAAVAALEPGELRRIQFSRQKIDYLLGAAGAVVAGELDLESLAAGSAGRAEERLSAVRGLGPWSVGYVMMRGLGFADCVPVGDSGLAHALERFFRLPRRPSPAETRQRMEPFRPYRSLATFHLWQTLEDLP